MEKVKKKNLKDSVVSKKYYNELNIKVNISEIKEDEDVVFGKRREIKKRKRRKYVKEIDLKVNAKIEYLKVEIGKRN
jgi:hypothetical protein